MRIERKCKTCGKSFSAIKLTQHFCSRKCFKRDYYLRNKGKLLDEKLHPKYPGKTCVFCGEKAPLSYDPTKDIAKFNAWQCPVCGITNQMIWEYHSDPQSHQIVAKLLQNGPVVVTTAKMDVLVGSFSIIQTFSTSNA